MSSQFKLLKSTSGFRLNTVLMGALLLGSLEIPIQIGQRQYDQRSPTLG